MTGKAFLWLVVVGLLAAGAFGGTWLGRRGKWVWVGVLLAAGGFAWAVADSIGRHLGGWRGMDWSLGAALYLLPPAIGLVAGALIGGLARLRKQRDGG